MRTQAVLLKRCETGKEKRIGAVRFLASFQLTLQLTANVWPSSAKISQWKSRSEGPLNQYTKWWKLINSLLVYWCFVSLWCFVSVIVGLAFCIAWLWKFTMNTRSKKGIEGKTIENSLWPVIKCRALDGVSYATLSLHIIQSTWVFFVHTELFVM